MATKPIIKFAIKPAVKTATKPKFKSDAFKAIHTSASALLKIGAIDEDTMRSFDSVPRAISPASVISLNRKRSQSAPGTLTRNDPATARDALVFST